MRLFVVLSIALVYSAPAIALPACPDPPAKRSNCVHDGDTWWAGGVKYRHDIIDTPEISDDAECPAEIATCLKARDRLIDLVAAGFTIESTGERDRYGRVLATIPLSDGREAGEVLMAEELAEEYGQKPPIDWCATR